MLIHTLLEHKIGVFVLFWASKPPFSGVSSTKSRFLCFLGIWSPHFRAFRAQNQGFCAFLAFETLVFRCFEHKIEVFVLFCPLEPSFSGISSTKSGFLCSRGGESGIGKRNREDAYHFATAPTPSHQRTSTSAPATAPQQWYQAPSSAIRCRVMSSSTVWHRLGTM